MIKEKCKNCEKEIYSGIWLASQFSDEKVYLFCSDKCKKEFLIGKLKKIKIEYPNFYKKLKKSFGKGTIFEELFLVERGFKSDYSIEDLEEEMNLLK